MTGGSIGGLSTAVLYSPPLRRAFCFSGRQIFSKLQSKKVALVMDNPTLPDPRECMDRKVMGYKFVQTLLSVDRAGSFARKCAITYGEHLAATAEYRAIIAKLHAMHPDMLIYDPAPALCDMRKGVCPVTRNGKFLYSYGDHISDSANTLVADQLLHQLEGSTRK
ncbi:SGNH hydrolase domain-containing protein [Paraburkholderia phymatum]|uniref:SGNH hydrolase domain-containing protein n=1 Tax=Paraburkholderia phymatum TaxID=148447 RepID=A0ACC6U353_9BURK